MIFQAVITLSVVFQSALADMRTIFNRLRRLQQDPTESPTQPPTLTVREQDIQNCHQGVCKEWSDKCARQLSEAEEADEDFHYSDAFELCFKGGEAYGNKDCVICMTDAENEFEVPDDRTMEGIDACMEGICNESHQFCSGLFDYRDEMGYFADCVWGHRLSKQSSVSIFNRIEDDDCMVCVMDAIEEHHDEHDHEHEHDRDFGNFNEDNDAAMACLENTCEFWDACPEDLVDACLVIAMLDDGCLRCMGDANIDEWEEPSDEELVVIKECLGGDCHEEYKFCEQKYDFESEMHYMALCVYGQMSQNGNLQCRDCFDGSDSNESDDVTYVWESDMASCNADPCSGYAEACTDDNFEECFFGKAMQDESCLRCVADAFTEDPDWAEPVDSELEEVHFCLEGVCQAEYETCEQTYNFETELMHFTLCVYGFHFANGNEACGECFAEMDLTVAPTSAPTPTPQLADVNTFAGFQDFCAKLPATSNKDCKAVQCGKLKNKKCQVKSEKKVKCKKFKNQEVMCELTGCKWNKRNGKCVGKPFSLDQ